MKKEIKGFIIGSLTTLILTASVGFATGNFKTIEVEENGVTIFANNNYVDAPNFLYKDRTYVPLRAVLELMDCNIEYNADTNSVWAYNNYQVSSNQLGSGIYLNGNTYKRYKTLVDTTAELGGDECTFVSTSIIFDSNFDIKMDDNNNLFVFDSRYVGIDTNAIPHTN